VNDSADTTRNNGRLLAWTALVGASALLIIGVKLIYDVPDDVRYRYSTVLFSVVVSALQLAIVLKIAGPAICATHSRSGGPRGHTNASR